MAKYDCSMGEPLDCLGEEASEVLQEIFKLKRFGHLRGGHAPGYTEGTPLGNLHKEIGDFLALLQYCFYKQVLDAGLVTEAKEAKVKRVKELFGVDLAPWEPE